MPFLDEILTYLKTVLDSTDNVEEVNNVNAIIDLVKNKEKDYNDLLNQYKKLLSNHETSETEVNVNLCFEDLIKKYL